MRAIIGVGIDCGKNQHTVCISDNFGKQYGNTFVIHNFQKDIEYLIEKTKFWDIHRNQPLNERQLKVLNKILDMGAENFEGGINTKKYISLTKVSKATAVRDITQLVEFGCITQIEGTQGRNIRYKVNV